MIGVIANSKDLPVVEEFFELFKTPWEPYAPGRSYEVVVSSGGPLPPSGAAQVIVVYGANRGESDNVLGLELQESTSALVEIGTAKCPIYGPLATVSRKGSAADRPFFAKLCYGEATLCRWGYDLFAEVRYLLGTGQPQKHAHVPALDLHISALRNLMLEAGLSVLEIPPVPAGRKFIGCLTHDIDFVALRQHLFDHTMAGFLYRATAGSLKDGLSGYRPWSRVISNFAAVLKLPLVHLGLLDDFWVPFGRYLEVENGRPSTFFLIPFKNTPGEPLRSPENRRRATAYDIGDVAEWVDVLEKAGCEVALHGIDAWHDAEGALREANRVQQFTSAKPAGLRMHWLYFNESSIEVLDKAGFEYDSTSGYNDAGGYKAGTGQVFRPIGATHLLELPMHLQDTALFYPDRMHLNEADAWQLCLQVIDNGEKFGGVVTLLWHDRSLVPERQWGDFYLRLLGEMDRRSVWWGTAQQVTAWFRQRRSVTFDSIETSETAFKVSFAEQVPKTTPGLLARVSWLDEEGKVCVAEAEIEGMCSVEIDCSRSRALQSQVKSAGGGRKASAALAV